MAGHYDPHEDEVQGLCSAGCLGGRRRLDDQDRSRSDSSKPEFARTTIDLGMVVSDVDKAAKFYTEAIGFTEQAVSTSRPRWPATPA